MTSDSILHEDFLSEKASLEAALKELLAMDPPATSTVEDILRRLHRLVLAERIQMSLRLIQLEDGARQLVSPLCAERLRGTCRAPSGARSSVALVTTSAFITEPEAAIIAGIRPKTLADRRRARRVPRELYRQDSRRGKVKYNVVKWRRHLGLEDSGT